MKFKPENIYISDFESSTGNDDGSTNIYLWGLKNLTGDKYYVDVKDTNFMGCIHSNKIKMVYFHNLSWDGKFIMHILPKLNYSFTMDKVTKEHKGKFSLMYDDRGQIYEIKVCSHTGKNVVTFRDTAKLFPMKVEEMGNILGFPKGEIDYHLYKNFPSLSDVPDILLEYLERDIDIVRMVYSEYIKYYPNHSFTTAGTALKSFKEHYGIFNYVNDFGGEYTSKSGKKITIEHITKDEWNSLKKAYKGGISVGNENIRHIRVSKIDGHSYDINSMYPYIMATKKMPYGKPYSTKPSGSYVCILDIFIFETHKIDMDMPNHLHNPKASLNSKVKFLENASNMYCSYIEEEWAELQLTYELVEGVNYEVIKRTYFKTKYIFTEWVNEMSLYKINATNPIERLSHKLTQNGLYGKTGEGYVKIKRILVYDPQHIELGIRYGDWVERTEKYEKESLSYIPIAICITAYSRILLIQSIRKNKKNFLYADTDSMYLRAPAVGIKLDESEYGAFKPEKRFSDFKWIKPKSYIVQQTHKWKDGKWVESAGIERALSGLINECHWMVNFDNFHTGHVILGGKKQKKNVEGGLILCDSNYTF